VRFLIALLLGLPSATVSAQEEPADPAVEATPESVFDAGIRAMERQDWIAAEVLFRRAYESDPNERTRLNLAEVLFEQDQLIAARVEAQAVLRGPDLLLRDAARDLVSRIDQRAATVRVRVRGVADDRSEVRLDGHPVERDVPHAVDPGEHTLALLVDDVVVAESTVRVGRGERGEAMLEPDLSPEAVANAGAAPHERSSGDDSVRTRRRRLAIGLSAGAVVAVAIVVAMALGVRTTGTPNGDVDPFIFEGMMP